MKAVMRVTQDDKPAILATIERIKAVLVEIQAKMETSTVADKLLILDPESRIKLGISSPILQDIATFDSVPVLLEYRLYERSRLASRYEEEPEKRIFNEKELAYILSNLQSSNFGLPRCLGFYDIADPIRSYFVHIYEMPQDSLGWKTVRTLFEVINKIIKDPKSPGKVRVMPVHSLSERLTFAWKLAVALLLIHSAGWLHKSISSENVVVLERSDKSINKAFPFTLGEPLLVGFQLSRPSSAETALENSGINSLVYQHPHRFPGVDQPRRFVRAYDVYSLGVVLLELGLWRTLSNGLDTREEQQICPYLQTLAQSVKFTIGDMYSSIVLWCLDLNKEDLPVDKFFKMVVEKLECLSSIV
jgi:serine/threonine protein kinase